MGLHPDAMEWLDEIERHRMGAGWRALVFVFVALAWMMPSAFVWFVGFVGVAGLGSEPGQPLGLLDGLSVSAAAPVTVAASALGAAAAALVAVARWAWPLRRRAATVGGVIAAVWVPAIATLTAIAESAGG